MNDYRSYKFRQDNDKLVLIIRKSSAEIIAEDDEIGEGTNPRIYGNHIVIPFDTTINEVDASLFFDQNRERIFRIQDGFTPPNHPIPLRLTLNAWNDILMMSAECLNNTRDWCSRMQDIANIYVHAMDIGD